MPPVKENLIEVDPDGRDFIVMQPMKYGEEPVQEPEESGWAVPPSFLLYPFNPYYDPVSLHFLELLALSNDVFMAFFQTKRYEVNEYPTEIVYDEVYEPTPEEERMLKWFGV